MRTQAVLLGECHWRNRSECDGWQQHFVLFCSARSDQTRDYCKHSEWTSHSWDSRLHHVSDRKCVCHSRYRRMWVVEQESCLRNPVLKCKALLCMCNIPLPYYSDNTAEEAIRALFPRGLVMVCWSAVKMAEFCVIHATEALYLWIPPENFSLVGLLLKPSTPVVFIKYFSSTPPTPPAHDIKILGCDILSCLILGSWGLLYTPPNPLLFISFSLCSWTSHPDITAWSQLS